MSSQGLEGYNQLTQMLRPYRELRGFYFGVRATLKRFCDSSEESQTTYTKMREIRVQSDSEGICVDYHPIRKERIHRAKYFCNPESPLLEPIKHPRPEGQNHLRGYFDQNNFELVMVVFRDAISSLSQPSKGSGEKRVDLGNGYTGIIKRTAGVGEKGSILTYKLIVNDPLGNSIPSEEISIYVQ